MDPLFTPAVIITAVIVAILEESPDLFEIRHQCSPDSSPFLISSMNIFIRGPIVNIPEPGCYPD